MTSNAPRIQLPDGLFDAREPDDEDAAPAAPADDAPEEAAPSAGLLALIGSVNAKNARRDKKSKTIGASVFARALHEVDEMLRSGDWAGAGPRHMVALYDRMHQRCYGVPPTELGPTERYNAVMLAGGMRKRQFGDDLVAMVEYMLWAWQREIERETWRRRTGKPGGRIGVRLMFSGALLTDYLVDQKRRAGAR